MEFIKNTVSNIKQRVSGAFSRTSEPTAQNIMTFEEGQGAPTQDGGKRRRKRQQKSKKGKKSKSNSKKSKSNSKKYKSRKHDHRR